MKFSPWNLVFPDDTVDTVIYVKNVHKQGLKTFSEDIKMIQSTSITDDGPFFLLKRFSSQDGPASVCGGPASSFSKHNWAFLATHTGANPM